ncbi:nucleotide-binding universal stress UspA family protein [Kibdelosporangium banguiense]|uniref:Nucleotide-binding universal stress UspA family protein n=1 Tax=Kibdelosporangium banguiense TaxID=1365924 RepID=A0ABS4TQC5_9PSEU|nr:universal stress protein [Kibdelosporangium banguiense]MBP2326608.1 nucleotide-binding universal stress UspA family protein [Kibdelosporangium banguiense]
MRERNAPVVVGIDGSSSALDAARWAAREATRRGAPLHLISAFGWSGTRHLGDPGLGNYHETMLRTTWEAVSMAAKAAAEAAGGVEISELVNNGFPVPLLVTESRQAGLIVIGDRGLGGFTSLLVGSVAVGLAARAECPVVVVRGERPLDTGPVVVGIDGSPVSEAALAFAFDAADSRNVPLIAVHAWTDSVFDAAVAPLLDWDAIETEERRLLAERLAGWSEKYPDVAVQRVVVRDRPAHALIGQAAHAQLVVVGSHGRGSAAGLVLGSVSHAVLHHSPCPVAFVRPEPS